MDDDQDNEFSQEINGENDVVEVSKIEDSNDEEDGTKNKVDEDVEVGNDEGNSQSWTVQADWHALKKRDTYFESG